VSRNVCASCDRFLFLLHLMVLGSTAGAKATLRSPMTSHLPWGSSCSALCRSCKLWFMFSFGDQYVASTFKFSIWTTMVSPVMSSTLVSIRFFVYREVLPCVTFLYPGIFRSYVSDVITMSYLWRHVCLSSSSCARLAWLLLVCSIFRTAIFVGRLGGLGTQHSLCCAPFSSSFGWRGCSLQFEH